MRLRTTDAFAHPSRLRARCVADDAVSDLVGLALERIVGTTDLEAL